MLNEEQIVNLDKLLNLSYTFYAHKKQVHDGNDIRYETIQEHTHLCIKHVSTVAKARNLETVFMNYKKFLFPDQDKGCWQLFDELIINTITFHDLGKINPRFQRLTMQNPLFINEKGDDTLGTDHSIISAILYLEYYLPKIKEFPKEIRDKFRLLTYINAYVISKHHGSLNRFENFLSSFNEEDSNYLYFAEIIREEYRKYFCVDLLFENKINCKLYAKSVMNYDTYSFEEAIALFAYERLMYSLLVASDYYATSEFVNNKNIIDFHGNIGEIGKIRTVFNNTNINQNIKKYREEKYFQNEKELEKVKDINVLRNELYLDTETELLKHIDEELFYLEAPTGSGKSNIAFNLSFHLIKECKNINKIMYIYPFNTLVEQNLKSIEKIFGYDNDIMSGICVVNSVTPIIKEDDDYKYEEYEKALLDRQFFNYPITLSTHVTLFNILFGTDKESGFSFYQISNSVIVIDEIQSYKITIWTEIITFLKVISKMLNIKIIIMSATLPNLDFLTGKQNDAIKLITNREKYFLHSLFKERVELDYKLLDASDVIEEIYKKLQCFMEQKKKILLEFITKKSAIEFYRYIIDKFIDFNFKIKLITGDDSNAERERIISELEDTPEGQPFLLIATQVIEAGIDLKNIDIGFKNISKLDSEEQFMGRVNRSNIKNGIVYFFIFDEAKAIYKKDARLNDELTVKSEDMRILLKNKKFDVYYRRVMEMIRSQNESSQMNKNINEFFIQVMKLNAPLISDRMKLIDDEDWCCTVFLNRKLTLINGEILDGERIWKEYKQLMLNKSNYEYAEWRVKLSIIKSKMNYFTYQISKRNSFPYTEQLGEIFYVHESGQYFEGDKFVREKLENQIGVFI